MAGLKEICVLVVDDNAQMRALLRAVLRAAGVGKVIEAGGAHAALDALGSETADIVLLDLAMKPLNGIELAMRLRAPDSPNRFVSIIMMTCHAQRSSVAAARDAGVNSFLAKPISGRSLIEHILAAINDTRAYVNCAAYFGPDRRRGTPTQYRGPRRRSGEGEHEREIDLDDFAPGARTARAS